MIFKTLSLAITGALFALANSQPIAAEDADDLGWSGTGQLGIVAARGNTDTDTLNAGLNLKHESADWRHEFGLVALRSTEDDETTAERYEGRYETNYKFDEVSYLFGSLRYVRDEFSGFDHQAAVAIGYGRELIDNDKHRLAGEIGVGYRISEERLTGEDVDETIARGSLDYEWDMSETATLGNRLLVEAGADNTFVENDFGLTVDINSAFALKLGVNVRHNTDVPAGTEETDTLTSFNLVYKFAGE